MSDYPLMTPTPVAETVSTESFHQEARGNGPVVQFKEYNMRIIAEEIVEQNPEYNTDILEELAMLISEMRGRIDKFDLKTLLETLSLSAEEAETIFNQLHKPQLISKLEKLIIDLSRIKENAAARAHIESLLRDFAPEDNTAQYIASQFISKYINEKADASIDIGDLVHTISQDLLRKDNGILAEINIAKNAYNYDTSNPQQSREFINQYKNIISSDARLSSILESVLKLVEGKTVEGKTTTSTVSVAKYLDAIDEIRQALGSDLNALHPSRAPEQLRHILSHILLLHQLNSVFRACIKSSRMITRFAQTYSSAPAA